MHGAACRACVLCSVPRVCTVQRTASVHCDAPMHCAHDVCSLLLAAGRMAPPASTRISARLKRVLENITPVNTRRRAGQSSWGCCGSRLARWGCPSPSTPSAYPHTVRFTTRAMELRCLARLHAALKELDVVLSPLVATPATAVAPVVGAQLLLVYVASRAGGRGRSTASGSRTW